jgi:hypothetical protein
VLILAEDAGGLIRHICLLTESLGGWTPRWCTTLHLVLRQILENLVALSHSASAKITQELH